MDWDDLTDKLSGFGEGLGSMLRRTFGSSTDRFVRSLEPKVEEINALEPWAQGLSAEEFQQHTVDFRKAVQEDGESLSAILPKAFALVREASVRTLGLRMFDVQLVGGIVLHQGRIAEMMTGEGKTLVATLPLYLNSLEGKPVYLVTVNDYLARRDCAWMQPIFQYMGVTSGAIQSPMNANERQPVYANNIVYGTNNEFGFDYLRDNMKTRLDQQVQRHLHFAIIDEVDSILIDEARTPLIISGPAEESSDKYREANRIAKRLKKDEHFEVKEKERSASLLEDGIVQAQKELNIESFYTPGFEDWPHYIENALRALHLYRGDREYVVEEGEVVIVDEFTGRKMTGRRWSDGLHQAVETKEGLHVRQENQTLATITFQNYFRLFEKLAGMTGTALTEANEFHKIYGLDVTSIPTNLPVARVDSMDVIYRTEKEKWKAIADETAEVHERGQPVLLGTTTVENSEKVAGILARRGIPHNVLNAKNHEKEAVFVARAGERGAVTVATNMAGRGTDIKLGGNYEWRLGRALEEAGLREGDPEHLAQIEEVRDRVRAECERDEKEVLGFGGLYVLCTERHEARRIDNQLRGRTGRQGNVGLSRFFLSLQDPLMRRFYKDGVVRLMEKLGMTEGQQIESKMVSRAIERAQKKVEDYNFEIRKSLLEYDEVMDQQRKTIYGVRQEVLESKDLREKVDRMMERSIERASANHSEDSKGFAGWFQRTFGFEIAPEAAESATSEQGSLVQSFEEVSRFYDQRVEATGEETMGRIEQYILLNAIDSRWKDHLHALDSLKTGIGLRGYGQVDPKNEYKKEGFSLFEKLIEAVEEEVSSLLLRIRVGSEAPPEFRQRSSPAVRYQGPAKVAGGTGVPQPRAGAPMRIPATRAFDAMRQRRSVESAGKSPDRSPGPAAAQAQPRRTATPTAAPLGVGERAVGRNDPCPCGSGKKYKKCHGRA